MLQHYPRQSPETKFIQAMSKFTGYSANAQTEHIIALDDESVEIENEVEVRFLPAFFILLLAVQFEWFKVAWLGDRSALLIAIICLTLSLIGNLRNSWAQFIVFAGAAFWVHVAYLAYLVSLAFSLGWTPNFQLGVFDLGRAASQYTLYILVGTYLIDKPVSAIAKTVLITVPFGITAFLFFCMFVFWQEGSNLISELSIALSSGKSNAVGTRVLTRIVNFQVQGGGKIDEEISGAIRNGISAGLLAQITMVWLFRNALPDSSSRLLRNFSLLVTSIIVPMILLLLMSRSSVLSFAAVPVFCMVLSLISRNSIARSQSVNVLFFAIVVGLILIVMIGFGLSENEVVRLNIQRLKDVKDDPRILHYIAVMHGILERPILGYGIGSPTPVLGHVHNFFLGGWYRAGLIGLATSLFFYICLVFRWFDACLLAIRTKIETSSLPGIFILPALMLGPLTRTPLVGGGDGRYVRVEWIAVAVFMATLSIVERQISDFETAEIDESSDTH